ncbi:hypothetical protein LNP04_14470 [Chryseobacterium sp. C-71]|uniref:hypothetical protein n=1 Tax=Chryseobacterium sp. C-71 TaxID=2893882 RepID=UPI001E422C85|nr:hypothetical protein [Chryseobacterium sp. C-71]UFH31169.1 hypothetical protein LNP04_14470 [Chryseobacterium sp. C-71]
MIKKKLSFISILIFICSTIISCHTEEYYSEIRHVYDSNYPTSSKRISIQDSKHKSKLLVELENSKTIIRKLNHNIFGKNISYKEGFWFDTEQIIYIENGPQLHTYTFSFYRENYSNEDPISNLLFVPTSEGTYAKYIVYYNFTEEEQNILRKGGNVDTKGKMLSVFIDGNKKYKTCVMDVQRKVNK